MNYAWQDYSSSNTYNVSAPGKYWITEFLNGCSASDTFKVNYFSGFKFPFPKDTLLCPGITYKIDLPVVKGMSYTWQDQSHQSFYAVSSPGKYWVTEFLNRCSVS